MTTPTIAEFRWTSSSPPIGSHAEQRPTQLPVTTVKCINYN